MQTVRLNQLEFVSEICSTIKLLSDFINDKNSDPFDVESAVVYRRKLKAHLNKPNFIEYVAEIDMTLIDWTTT